MGKASSGSSVSAEVAGDYATRFRCECSAASQSILGDVVVIVIGRIDELHSLRAALDLDSGADLSTIVRQAYRKWGAHEFAEHLYGDFCIVLWDHAAQRLLLSRSPSGHYPLCYTQRDSQVWFSSRPQDLVRQDASVSLDEEALARWLILRSRLSDQTLFHGIRWVPPGASVLFEREGRTTSTYWQPEALTTLHLRDHREYADAVRETLGIAVRDRLRAAEGTIACQLSGGLDSSSVATLTAEQLAASGKDLFAFTAIPGKIGQAPVDGRFFDESSHAAAVARAHNNIRHTCVSTEATSLFEVLDRYTDIEAGPPFNPHHLQWIDQTYAAASGVGATTLLTGSMGNMTISASGSLAAIDALQQGRLLHAAQLFAADRRSGTRTFRNLPGTLVAAWAPSLLDVADRLRHVRLNIEELTGLRPEFARAHGLDLDRWNRRLPFQTIREQTLDSVDRFDAGMFHEAPRRLYGLNATDPTFDRRVVELALRIPIEQFCADGVPRAIIRTAMQGRLPDMVRLERRRGLQSADFLSMLDRERTAIAEELHSMSGIDLLCRAIDIPLLQQRMRWTSQEVIAYGWHQYSNRLMRAISIGRFVRRTMEGSLLSTMSSQSDPASGSTILQR